MIGKIQYNQNQYTISMLESILLTSAHARLQHVMHTAYVYNYVSVCYRLEGYANVATRAIY